MLDERQLKICEMLSIGTPITEIASVVGVSRQTIYDWKKIDEMRVRLDELGREFISSTKQAIISYAPKAMKIIKDLAEHATSEKIRLEAAKILIDKTISNACKIELSNGNENNDTVPVDLLDEEFKQFDSE